MYIHHVLGGYGILILFPLTDSTIIGNDTFNLSILGLESADSKNYTCTPETDAVKNTDNSYRHYVIGKINETI